MAEIRPSPEPGRYYLHDSEEVAVELCPSPYDVSGDAPAPTSYAESMAAHKASILAVSEVLVTLPFITASEWDITPTTFRMAADVNDVVQEHGQGVYAVLLTALVDGEPAVISEYAIFHDVQVPEA